MEREVYVADFEELRYQGESIGDVLDDQGWIEYLKREGVASADLFWEFYAVLLDVVDIDAQVWSVTVCGPRKHTTKCPVERGEFMLYVAKGGIVDLPLYTVMSLRAEAKISGTTMLPYSVLLTQFLHGVGCMDGPNEEWKTPIGPIYRITLSRSEAQIRW
ncbi:hypothetical protein CJ030_MR4G010936 [Morella rubra]|uniref:Uncharacterized protein n=1 Tax=Morella rubra TaxID=262757 RepID=A0A6A1VZ42_9ROSI|nr:hypothetical protein CJ030_MR4G010936 [Morella rubra]